MSVPTGPRKIEYLGSPLGDGSLAAAGDLGMAARLGEPGEQPPDGIDATWCRIEPISPTALIQLHQTDLTFRPHAERPSRLTPEPPQWLYTLGPFKSGPFVHSVRAHWTRRLSLALRDHLSDGQIRTLLWHDIKVAVDFDAPSGAFWIDWTAEPVGEDRQLWRATTVNPHLERLHDALKTPDLERTA